MVTREQAKEQLKTLGVENPTDEQITTYLNNVNSEANKEKARADKYKADADKAKELEEKVAELENQNLTDAEKQQKENEALQKQIKDLTENNLKIEAKAILAKAGMDDESIEALLPGMIADTLENTQARANAYVTAMNKSIENAIKSKEKDDLDGTGTPGGDNGGDGKEKTEAEKFAESYGKEAGEAAKASSDIISSYLE